MRKFLGILIIISIPNFQIPKIHPQQSLIKNSVPLIVAPSVKKQDTTLRYAISVIKKYEGYSSVRYHLFGDNYIGYGHLLYKWDTITKVTGLQADSMLRVDFNNNLNAIKRNLEVSLPDNRLYVLTMLSFNTGCGRLFRSDLFKHVNNKMPDSCIYKDYTGFVYAKGKYIPSLLDRRKEEFKLW